MDSEEALNRLLSETSTMADVIEHIRNLLEALLQRVEKGLGANKAGARPVGTGADAGASRNVAQQIGAFATSMAAATAAVLAFVAVPPLMAGVAAQFVGALNPGLVEQFSRVLANLQATIGYGLEPVIQVAVATIQAWSATLMPAMRALRPVLEDLALTVGGVLLAALNASVQMFRVTTLAIAPVLKVLGVLVRWVANIVDVFATLFGAVFDVGMLLLEQLGVMDALSVVLKTFKDVLNGAVTGLFFLALALTKVLSGVDAVTKFRQALEKRLAERKAGVGGMVAAPKDSSVGGIEDISRKMTERAFQAMGGGAGAKSDNELLEQLVEMAGDVEKWDLEAMIKRGIRDGMREARETVAAPVERAFNSVLDISSTPVDWLRRIATPSRDE